MAKKVADDDLRYLNVKIFPKLQISQSKFSDSRKFILRYQQFEIPGVKISNKKRNETKFYSLKYEDTLRYYCSRYLELTAFIFRLKVRDIAWFVRLYGEMIPKI